MTKDEVLASLNAEQRQAVIDYEGDMSVSAGPGAGKTRTIVARCQYMILDGVKPSSILAFTFTKKAANELRDRIEIAVGSHAAKEMTISTYHSFCGRLLRKFAEYVGRSHSFSIYDEDDKKGVLAPICKAHANFKYAQACSYISNFKLRKILPSQAIAMKYDNSFAAVAARIYKEYDDVMAKCNAFDFDDLVFRAYLLLKNYEAVRQFIYNKYKYILADEFQDSSDLDVDLILLLRGDNKNLCTIYDDDQSIYSFRGADIKRVLKAVSGDEFKKVVLKTNYRSTQSIVNASSAVINHNAARIQKELDTDNENGAPIDITKYNTSAEESRGIAYKIREEHEVNKIPYREIAILTRLQWHTRELERNLLDLGIPYKLKGILPFYARREIKDMTAYLRIIANPSDMEAYARAICTPKRNIGPSSLEKIFKKARQNETPCDIISVYKELSFQQKMYNGFSSFENLINRFRNSTYEDVGKLLESIVKEIQYNDFLENECADTQEYQNRTQNVQELIYFCSNFSDINEFLSSFVIESDNPDEEKEEEKDAVNVMTMHGAKGLEYKVVFLYSMNDTVVPFIKSQDSLSGIEEERRLFYVGMTRAKKKLYISYASVYGSQGAQSQKAFASRFIDEIPSQYQRRLFVS